MNDSWFDLLSVEKNRKTIVGIICAIGMGLLNGSLLLPVQYLVENEDDPEAFLIPFSITSVVISPIFLLIYSLIRRKRPEFYFKDAFFMVFLSGVIWTIGSYCSIYAVIFLGISFGFPLTQTALVVCGVWGIFVFKEIRVKEKIYLWCASLIIILTGVIMLSMSRKNRF